ncbi:MAG: carboxylate--amine ligase [Fastidiosipila sp.]|nr:carboxylate--amine ligase [Fastidiosipila sp.]
MEDFLTIILGTDAASYTLARNIYDAYNQKPVVCGAAILIPFYRSSIAEIRIAENFNSDPDVFVSVLNKVYADKKNQYKNFVILLPWEHYLRLLYDNIDRLDFRPILPYPKKELVQKYVIKSNFYERMEEMGVLAPQTYRLNQDNYQSLSLEGELFMKADDFNLFNVHSIEGKKKGYHLKNRDLALAELGKIYASDFRGDMLVQPFIHGGDGTEYTVNGYRASDGAISICLARALLMDKRPMWVGNYLVLCDSQREELNRLAAKIIRGLDYYGFFNFDFKIDAETGEIYVFELNFRLGRSSYCARLAGVNLPQVAISDLIYNQSKSYKGDKPFNWVVVSPEASSDMLTAELRKVFLQKERMANTGNAILYDRDSNLRRNLRLKDYLKKMEKEYMTGNKL